jgi:hypothetical protein
MFPFWSSSFTRLVAGTVMVIFNTDQMVEVRRILYTGDSICKNVKGLGRRLSSVKSRSRQAACRLLSFIQSEAIGAVYNLL